MLQSNNSVKQPISDTYVAQRFVTLYAGTEEIKFLYDTGCTNSVISMNTAKRIDALRYFSTTDDGKKIPLSTSVITASNTVNMYKGRITALKYIDSANQIHLFNNGIDILINPANSLDLFGMDLIDLFNKHQIKIQTFEIHRPSPTLSLMQKSPQRYEPAFIKALEQQDFATCKQLINKDMNWDEISKVIADSPNREKMLATITMRNEEDETLLYYAAMGDIEKLGKRNNEIDHERTTAALKFLLDHGADPNIQEQHDSRTPLYRTITRGNLSGTQLLLERKAEPNLVCMRFSQNTPLLEAVDNFCRHHEIFFGIIKLLIEHGADLNITSHDGNTALIKALRLNLPDIAIYLLDQGAKPKVEKNTDEKQNYSLTTALHAVVRIKNEEQCELLTNKLIEKGADINAKDGSGMTPLYNAAVYENLRLFKILLKQKDCNRLAKVGLPFEAKTVDQYVNEQVIKSPYNKNWKEMQKLLAENPSQLASQKLEITSLAQSLKLIS